MTAVPPCSWWLRWYHRRLRRLDASTIIQLLVERAPDGKFLEAVSMFWLMDGQDHWRCPCSVDDRALYLATFKGLEDEPHPLHPGGFD